MAKSTRKALAPTVVCFGEVLWDCLPKGLFLGGAPINAAYHLSKHGLQVLPVSAVGADFLGDEVHRRIGAWGLDTQFIARHKDRPTGTVRAVLDPRGVAKYEIAQRVAWDRIVVTPRLLRTNPQPAALVYGTLSLREKTNRVSLQTLVDAWPETLRVVDLNFRAPFDTAKVTAFALRAAHMVKLNEDELAKLTGTTTRTPSGLQRAAKSFAQQHRISRICVTAGERGAGLWWEDQWIWEAGRPVNVRDTIGAGDSFLGALLGALLARRADPAVALAEACRMGEFVASRDGATPAYRLDRDARPIAVEDR
jgi:fructokinase